MNDPTNLQKPIKGASRFLQCLNLYVKRTSAWRCASFSFNRKNMKHSPSKWRRARAELTWLTDNTFTCQEFLLAWPYFAAPTPLWNFWPHIRSRLIMRLCMWNVRDGSLSLWNALTEPNKGRKIPHRVFPVFCSHNSCHGKRTKAWMDPSVAALWEGEMGSCPLFDQHILKISKTNFNSKWLLQLHLLTSYCLKMFPNINYS